VIFLHGNILPNFFLFVSKFDKISLFLTYHFSLGDALVDVRNKITRRVLNNLSTNIKYSLHPVESIILAFKSCSAKSVTFGPWPTISRVKPATESSSCLALCEGYVMLGVCGMVRNGGTGPLRDEHDTMNRGRRVNN
jgi:hypothetical protein